MATVVYYLVGAGWGFLMDRYATEVAKEEILPDITKGKTFLGIASTEATGGSDIVVHINHTGKKRWKTDS